MIRIIFFLILILIIPTANYTGFCFFEFRYLSDQERIHGAVEDYINSHKRLVNYRHKLSDAPFKYKNKFLNDVVYRSTDEFYQINPNCCEVSRSGKEFEELKGFTIPLGERINGYSSHYIRISAQRRYKNFDDKLESVPVIGFSTVSNCGDYH